ncbi:MAG: hypothetical protein RR867_01860 [Ruthenibacterium sp.]
MSDKTEKKQKIQNKIVRAILAIPPSETDPNGSYTGKPCDENAVPQQDADDL